MEAICPESDLSIAVYLEKMSLKNCVCREKIFQEWVPQDVCFSRIGFSRLGSTLKIFIATTNVFGCKYKVCLD